MEQQKALNALEPYLAMAKMASSPRAASDVITQATNAPHTYVFGELVSSPNIQALRDAPAEHAVALTLLEIFAWGTWTDYTSTPSLPKLTEIQTTKLKQLTLLSLQPTSYTYPSLQKTLNLPSNRALEDLLISAIYTGLLSAKLSPRTQTLQISSLSPLRDLAPSSVPALTDTLTAWSRRCGSVLGDLEREIAQIRARAVDRAKKEGALKKAQDIAMEAIDPKKGDKGLKRGILNESFAAEGDEMDIDDTADRRKNAKRPTGKR